MTDLNIEDFIKRGESAAENQNHAEALSAYDQAIILAAESHEYGALVRVLAQKLIIYKHKYQTTGEKSFLELMHGEAITGMGLVEKYGLAGHPKAVMLLRSGDYYFENSNYTEAAKYYKHALDALESDSIAQPEFLGHYGSALALTGDITGLNYLNTALKKADADERLRPFHKLIIISGIRMRMAEAHYFLNDGPAAAEQLKLASDIAHQLKLEHDMGMREVQVNNLKSKLQIQ